MKWASTAMEAETFHIFHVQSKDPGKLVLEFIG